MCEIHKPYYHKRESCINQQMTTNRWRTTATSCEILWVNRLHSLKLKTYLWLITISHVKSVLLSHRLWHLPILYPLYLLLFHPLPLYPKIYLKKQLYCPNLPLHHVRILLPLLRSPFRFPLFRIHSLLNHQWSYHYLVIFFFFISLFIDKIIL